MSKIVELVSEFKTKKQLGDFLYDLSDQEILAMTYDFFGLWARPSQQIPPGDWTYWVIMSGRGWGKTKTGSETMIKWAYDNPGWRIALIAQTKSDARDVMIESGPSSILQCSPPWFKPSYEPSKRRIAWPNGTIGHIYSGDEPDQLRGPNHHAGWLDELCKMQYPKDTWSNFLFGLRLGDHPKAVITTTPRPLGIMKKLMMHNNTHLTVGATKENEANLARTFIQEIYQEYEGTRLGRQELEGEFLEEMPGALWTRSLLERTRIREGALPEFVEIVVAIDPATTVKKESSETGIVVGGRGTNGHFYALADLSGRYSPREWAKKACKAYHDFQADRIVAESNQGGDMVKEVILTEDRELPIKLVHASRGKFTRAEPVATKWERGQAHLVGSFEQLEDQMCTYTLETASEIMKDRLDSLVWAATALVINQGGFEVL